ncbi:MAG: fumarylacetoacetase [Solirubrobacteraceae bacterium]|nr:fumarylacetoacetase [Solirubrobacteraceae bacterium]
MTGFGLANLPYGVFRRAGEEPRVGVRYGDGVLDLAALAADGLIDDPAGAFAQPALDAFMARGPAVWAATRERVQRLLSGVDAEPRLVALDEVELLLPFAVADYVDFWSSIHHAANSGRIFRPEGDPLPPNWRHMPIGYHGRSATVVVSGTPVRRPHGQSRAPDRDAPVFGPTRKLDVELELGFVVGTPSALGEPVAVDRALEHVFGVVLLNDWSARDLQAWESRPLGPFTGKSFATSISAWVVPMAALERFRVPGAAQEPAPPAYLREDPWAVDVGLEIELNGERVAQSNGRHLYWSVAQQIAHLTANGASLRTGDLLGSGTISGPEREERGSLLELSWNGREPLTLADGTQRTFLEDGDEAVLRGVAGAGEDAVALGEVRGRIVG